jgi:hypothetical protein
MQCSKQRRYSITSSARCWRYKDTSRRSAFAALRLIVPGWRLHRQVSWLLALEHAIDVGRCAPIIVDEKSDA